MFLGTRARTALRSVMQPRMGAARLLRFGLVSLMGVFVLFVVTASARVEPTATGPGAGAAGGPSGLVVKGASVRRVDGRIVGAARIVNVGNAAVRSTTGVLGLRRDGAGVAQGILTFPVASLGPRRSRTVRFRTPPVGSLRLRSGPYAAVVCADVFSQVRRFMQSANCSNGGRLAVSTDVSASAGPLPSTGIATTSGPAPRTILTVRPADVSRSSTAAFGFASTVAASTFECSLDGGPWIVCNSPRRLHTLVDGRHRFAVRAIDPAGRKDATPARTSWTIDDNAPMVTLTSPAGGSKTGERKPTFSGLAGTGPADQRPDAFFVPMDEPDPPPRGLDWIRTQAR